MGHTYMNSIVERTIMPFAEKTGNCVEDLLMVLNFWVEEFYDGRMMDLLDDMERGFVLTPEGRMPIVACVDDAMEQLTATELY